MIEKLSIPMWVGGAVVPLSAVLAAVPDNAWDWRFLYFFGVGQPPEGTESMPEFEEATTAPEGYRISWEDLKEFVYHLDQVYDCLLVAFPITSPPSPEELQNDEFDRCEVLIEAVDSSEWSLGVNTRNKAKTNVLHRWKDLSTLR